MARRKIRKTLQDTVACDDLFGRSKVYVKGEEITGIHSEIQ